MNILQTYETTIADADSDLSATVLVIPARSLPFDPPSLQYAAEVLFETKLIRTVKLPYIDPDDFTSLFVTEPRILQYEPPETLAFASYVLNARIIPFESSPLGAESLASIAAPAVKAGTITLGATVGFIAAGPTPFLLITVPLGIVLCGVSVSFAKWIEENRNKIWNKLARRQ